MMSLVARALYGLAHPRSRRTQLWACVYCGTFDGPETDEPPRRAR